MMRRRSGQCNFGALSVMPTHHLGWRIGRLGYHRAHLVAITCVVLSAALCQATAIAESGWSALKDGTIVLYRHANAPGVGDPANFKLGDCRTQRNLDAAGRAQAQHIGAQFRMQRIPVRMVLTSQWCRTRETAQLAFPGMPIEAEAFNSFFGSPERNAAQTSAALKILSQWMGPRVLGLDAKPHHTSQKSVSQPQGVFGGAPGDGGRWVINEGMASQRVLPFAIGDIESLDVGDVVTHYTPGGGGYGAAQERDPRAVLRDVRNGFVSAGAAASAYGVSAMD